jgi:hypothetical protein
MSGAGALPSVGFAGSGRLSWLPQGFMACEDRCKRLHEAIWEMPYVVAFVLVVVFTVNVAVGALGDAPIVSNVVEVLILFAAAIAFSVGILKSEADEKARTKETSTKNGTGQSRFKR